MIFLCAISNIESGNCNEDCKFCTQSVKNRVNSIERYRRKEIQTIIEEAKRAKAHKAIGFCLVTAGKGLNESRLEYVCETAKAVKKEVDISLITCNGTASKDQLKELKKAGVDNYNHNLETAESFYPSICTTHDWHDRYMTCEAAKEVGLNLCTGGIIGLGESERQRSDFLDAIKTLDPMSVPLNLFHSNPDLPIESKEVTKEEAVSFFRRCREALPNQMIMLAGGRERVFKNELKTVFESGVNAIVIGDYLTTSGNKAQDDLKEITSLGLEIAKECHAR